MSMQKALQESALHDEVPDRTYYAAESSNINLRTKICAENNLWCPKLIPDAGGAMLAVSTDQKQRQLRNNQQ